jgi:hypothetical protein
MRLHVEGYDRSGRGFPWVRELTHINGKGELDGNFLEDCYGDCYDECQTYELEPGCFYKVHDPSRKPMDYFLLIDKYGDKRQVSNKVVRQTLEFGEIDKLLKEVAEAEASLHIEQVDDRDVDSLIDQHLGLAPLERNNND